MNYKDDKGNIVSYDEIIQLINEKLLKLQTELFNYNIDGKKNITINSKTLDIVKLILTILSVLLCVLFGTMCIVDFTLQHLIYLIFSIFGYVIITLLSKEHKSKKLPQNNNQSQNEAIILQEARKFLQGKTPINSEIQSKIDTLINEIISSRQ